MSVPPKSINKLTVVGLVLAVLGFVGIIITAMVASNTDSHYESEPVTVVNDGYTMGTTGDPAADDGELHDARNTDVSYKIREETWSYCETDRVRAYDMDVEMLFIVSYPKLEGDLPYIEKANTLLRNTARATVIAYYEDPSSKTVEAFKRRVESADKENRALDKNADAYLSSHVKYAVSYNSNDLLSVCFSDECYLGTWMDGYIKLRTVNVNLKTGEVYELDDVLTVDEAIASTFVDNLMRTSGTDRDGNGKISDEECETVRIGGREALINAIQGKGEQGGPQVQSCLFIDGAGRPNLGVTYVVRSDGDYVHGWWDVTIPDDQLEAAHKESTLWDLLPDR